MASYLGKSPARLAIVTDDTINSAKIIDNTITSADILNATITGADLASDISFTTTGAIKFGTADENIQGDGVSVLNINSGGAINLAGNSTNITSSGTNIANFKSQGSKLLVVTNSSQNVILETDVADKDLIFKGNDGGSVITALTLDMSDAGAATFNDNVSLGSSKQLKFHTSGDNIQFNGTNLQVTATNALVLDGDQQIIFNDGGVNYGAFVYNGSSRFTLHSQRSDVDFAINVNDGGSQLNAVIFDASAGGAATFNDKIVLGVDKVIEFGDAGENISGDGTSLTIASSHNTLIDSANQIIFDAGNGLNIFFRDDGALIGQVLKSNNNDFKLKGLQSGKLFVLEGLDSGGSLVQALSLDMSDAGSATFNNNVTVGGNLTVNGTTTTLNTATLDVEDLNIKIAKGAANAAAANNAGITVDGADACLRYRSSCDAWTFNKNLGIGAENPAHNLHIKSTGSASIFIEADSDNTDETHTPKLSMSSDGNTSSTFNIGIEGNAGTEFTGSLANAPYIHAKNNISQPLQLANAGNMIMTLRDGKVGIGTTAPTNNLHIFTDASSEGILIKSTGNTYSDLVFDANRSSAGNNLGRLRGNWNGTAVAMINFDAGDDTTNKDNADITFHTASAGTMFQRMKIADDGKVGIGTTSLTSGANLTLSGNGFGTVGADSGSIAFGSNPSYQGRIYQDNAGSDLYIENTYSNNNGDIIIKTNGSERVRVKGSGNIGIGTSSPGRQLEVAGQGVIRLKATGNGDPGLDFNTATGGNQMQVRYRGTPEKLAIFSYGTNTDVLTIQKSDGKVGIGTSNPNRMLTVEGDGGEPDISLVNLDNTNNNFNQLRFLSVGSDDSTRRLGADIKALYTSHSTVSPTTDLVFGTASGSSASTESMRILSDGKVGIGTSAPSYKAHIQGTDGVSASIRAEATSADSDAFIVTDNDANVFSMGIDGDNADSWVLSNAFGLSNPKITVKPGGFVGIGETAPQSLLHIKGTSTSSQIIIENTDAGSAGAPDIFLYRNSASPADGDAIGHFEFRGKNSAGEETRYAVHNAQIVDQTDGTEDGKLEWQILNNGSFQKVLTLTPSETVINEDSGDTDFRVESDGNANMLFVNGGNNRVGIGLSNPDAALDVKTGSSSGAIFRYDAASTFLAIIPEDANGNVGIRFRANSGSAPDLFFKNDAGAEMFRIGNNGKVGIGTSAPSVKLDVRATSFTPYNTNTTLITEAPAVFSQAQHFYIYNAGSYNNSRPSGGIGAINSSNVVSLSAGSIVTANPGADGFKATSPNSSLYEIGNGDHTFRTKTGLTVGDQFTHQTKMIIKDSGNVGIGTSSPAHNLEIVATASGSINDSLQIRNNTTTTGSGSRLRFITSTDLNSDTNGASIASVRNGDDNDLVFEVENAEAMRIDHAGRVGIGTSSPNSITNLQIGDAYASEPMIRIETTDGGNKRLDLYVSGGHGYVTSTQSAQDLNLASRCNLIFKTNASSERMRISNTGNVGIGLTNPNANLNIVQASNTQKLLRLRNNTADTSNGDGFTVEISDNSDPLCTLDIVSGSDDAKLAFSTNRTERMRIASNGNIGIGTTSPSNKLDLVGNAEINGKIFIRKDGASEREHLVLTNETNGTSASPTFTDLHFNGYSGKDRGRISVGDRSNNKVGGIMKIQTAGSESTDGSGLQTRIFLDNDGDIFFYEDTGTTAKVKWDATNERFGIGTISPQNKLEVYNTSNGGVITAHRNSEASGDYTGYEFHTNSSSTDFKKGAIYFKASGNGYGRGDIVFCNDRVADGANVGLADEKFRIAENGRLQTNATNNRTGHLNLIGERGSQYKAVVFEHTSDGGQIGTITTTSSAVSYNTSSDYRLKENVVDMTNATDRLKQLQPKRFNFIADADTTVDGFIAHEVSSIVPEAITGEKDAVQVWQEGDELPEGVSVGDNKVDENGNTIPEYQGIDQAKLVPLLVKTIQELEARIKALEDE